MRLLLLQARKHGDPAAAHEQEAFAGVIGVDLAQVVPWDVIASTPTDRDLQAADCILVGGAGDFGVGDARRHSWLVRFIDTMGRLTTMDVPVFASCFGFQALVVACGGRVETDNSRAEIGTFEVTVTEAGREDPLFKKVAPRFYAQFGHVDCVTALPTGLVNLARTERNAFQAARVPGRPIYLTQFHPELSMEANRERTIMYADSYANEGFAEVFDEILRNFRESPSSSALLRRFIRDLLGLR